MGKHIVIVADGQFPTHPLPLEALHVADVVICCDNAILKLEKFSARKCDFIVGDMDTMSSENRVKYASLIHQESEQEHNDLTKAFRFAMTLNPSKISIIGATGLREDHTLGNISLVAEYAKRFKNVEMITDYGLFFPLTDSSTFECGVGRKLSIFSFDSTLNIRSTALKYSTDNVVFDLWWKATLNESTADKVTLTFSHPALVLIYLPHC